MKTYSVFTRNWWKENPSWPDGREPDGGAKRRYLAEGLSLGEAKAMAKQWNRENDPGKLSKKAEFEQE